MYTAVAAGLNFVEKKIGTWNDPENSRVINYLVSAVLVPEPPSGYFSIGDPYPSTDPKPKKNWTKTGDNIPSFGPIFFFMGFGAVCIDPYVSTVTLR